jgi:phosphopantothenoylcysteine decarboxylase
MGDPVLHIQLRDWADIALVAPLSAHTLAKIAGGLCDDTLTCILRAWDFRPTGNRQVTNTNSKPILLAPAMNTAMWNHPLTQQQFQIIQSFSASDTSIVKVLPPVVKTLACGDIGTGAMADLADITIEVMHHLSYKGRRDAST